MHTNATGENFALCLSQFCATGGEEAGGGGGGGVIREAGAPLNTGGRGLCPPKITSYIIMYY